MAEQSVTERRCSRGQILRAAFPNASSSVRCERPSAAPSRWAKWCSERKGGTEKRLQHPLEAAWGTEQACAAPESALGALSGGSSSPFECPGGIERGVVQPLRVFWGHQVGARAAHSSAPGAPSGASSSPFERLSGQSTAGAVFPGVQVAKARQGRCFRVSKWPKHGRGVVFEAKWPPLRALEWPKHGRCGVFGRPSGQSTAGAVFSRPSGQEAQSSESHSEGSRPAREH